MNHARVAVVGGSLGGLTAGLLVRDLGMDVTIHERSPAELQQRGAGIGFLPDSYRYLVERAGMSLDEISTLTTRIQYLPATARSFTTTALVPLQLLEHGLPIVAALLRPRPVQARE